MSKHILVVGTGSVGKRHATNLSDLDCTVSCVDPRRDRLDEIAGEGVRLKSVFTSLEEAFATKATFDAVVVGSPPRFHVDQSIAALERGKPVLLEKPVSPDLSSGLKLQSAVQHTCRLSAKLRPIDIASPTDFIEVVSSAEVPGNFSKVKRGILVTT